MADAQYLLFTGEYDERRLVAEVSGPENPPIETLMDEFRDKYLSSILPIIQEAKEKGYGYFRSEFQEAEAEASRVLKAEGLMSPGPHDQYDLNEAFVKWLLREKGFTEVASEDVQLDFREETVRNYR